MKKKKEVYITEAQAEALRILLRKDPHLEKMILNRHNLKTIAHLAAEDYERVSDEVDRIRELKRS